MNRVTLDTNVYVSAFKFGGKPRDLVRLCMEGKLRVAVSQPIIDETLRILRDKFRFQAAELDDVVLVLKTYMQPVSYRQTLNVAPGDPDDNQIIECALAAGSDALVTGDQDLLRMGSYQGIQTRTVRSFWQQVRNSA